MTVEWIDQMPRKRTARPGRARWDWDAIAQRLRERPGVWALVARDIPRSHAYAIQSGAKVAFRPVGDWMAYTRREEGRDAPSNCADLYVAFVGSPGARARAMESMR